VPSPPKKEDDQAIGHSRGGLSTKIHSLVDALGNPLALLLTPGQAHDLVGADALLPQMAAGLLIADKAFDADKRVRDHFIPRRPASNLWLAPQTCAGCTRSRLNLPFLHHPRPRFRVGARAGTLVSIYRAGPVLRVCR
jgi:Transposase DDE domain